jgi:phosphopantetheinyl transferase (holo-ACP synthase)
MTNPTTKSAAKATPATAAKAAPAAKATEAAKEERFQTKYNRAKRKALATILAEDEAFAKAWDRIFTAARIEEGIPPMASRSGEAKVARAEKAVAALSDEERKALLAALTGA